MFLRLIVPNLPLPPPPSKVAVNYVSVASKITRSLPTSPPPSASTWSSSVVLRSPSTSSPVPEGAQFKAGSGPPSAHSPARPLPLPALPLHSSHRSLVFHPAPKQGGIQQVCGNCRGVPGGPVLRLAGRLCDLDVRVRAVDLRGRWFSQALS